MIRIAENGFIIQEGKDGNMELSHRMYQWRGINLSPKDGRAALQLSKEGLL